MQTRFSPPLISADSSCLALRQHGRHGEETCMRLDMGRNIVTLGAIDGSHRRPQFAVDKMSASSTRLSSCSSRIRHDPSQPRKDGSVSQFRLDKCGHARKQLRPFPSIALDPARLMRNALAVSIERNEFRPQSRKVPSLLDGDIARQRTARLSPYRWSISMNYWMRQFSRSVYVTLASSAQFSWCQPSRSLCNIPVSVTCNGRTCNGLIANKK